MFSFNPNNNPLRGIVFSWCDRWGNCDQAPVSWPSPCMEQTGHLHRNSCTVCHSAPLCRAHAEESASQHLNQIKSLWWSDFRGPALNSHTRMLVIVSFLVASNWKELICLTGNWLTDYDAILSSVKLSWAKTPNTWCEKIFLWKCTNSGQDLEPDPLGLPPSGLLAGWHWVSHFASISLYVTWNSNRTVIRMMSSSK